MTDCVSSPIPRTAPRIVGGGERGLQGPDEAPAPASPLLDVEQPRAATATITPPTWEYERIMSPGRLMPELRACHGPRRKSRTVARCTTPNGPYCATARPECPASGPRCRSRPDFTSRAPTLGVRPSYVPRSVSGAHPAWDRLRDRGGQVGGGPDGSR